MDNDRIKNAKRSLATLEGDVRHRVSVAAKILSKILPMELSVDDFKKITEIVNSATRFNPMRDALGNIIRDSFEETAKRSKNRTAAEIAKKIYDL